jgi:hypothetical protein
VAILVENRMDPRTTDVSDKSQITSASDLLITMRSKLIEPRHAEDGVESLAIDDNGIVLTQIG